MKAILLMSYGTPKDTNQVEAYYTHIRGGRRPTDSEIDELRKKYIAIGGSSPLIRITESLASKLRIRLATYGSQSRVYVAMKHSEPFIRDVVARCSREGNRQLLGIVLAPHYSKMSTETYIKVVEEANSKLDNKMKLDFVDSWYRNELFLSAWERRIKEALQRFHSGCTVIFSAHSLPEKILSEGDPYKEQLLETSRLLASRLNIEDWKFAFQSVGNTHDKWLGPDIIELLQQLYEQGRRSFVIAPIGFVSDHLEVLYDIDIECKQWATARGAELVRCRSMNVSDEFVECLISIIREAGFL